MATKCEAKKKNIIRQFIQQNYQTIARQSFYTIFIVLPTIFQVL